MRLIRDATRDDLATILAIQEAGSVLSLSHIFPQDLYPYPRAELAAQWAEEIDDPSVRVLVIEDGGGTAGFAALQKDLLLHFGTAVSTWGTGLATAAHAEIRELLPRAAFLWVLTENHRARRFYTKVGWRPTGRTQPDPFPPNPQLMEYGLRTR